MATTESREARAHFKMTEKTTLAAWANGVFNLDELAKEGAKLSRETVLGWNKRGKPSAAAQEAFNKLAKHARRIVVSWVGSPHPCVAASCRASLTRCMQGENRQNQDMTPEALLTLDIWKDTILGTTTQVSCMHAWGHLL